MRVRPSHGTAASTGATARTRPPGREVKPPELGNVRLNVTGQVARLELHRPEAHNVLDRRTLEELLVALDFIATREDVDVVVFSSAHERLFTAGADITQMAEMDVIEARRFAELGHQVARRFETVPQPVIAAVHGACMGGGMEFIAACDIRVASEDAVFAQPEIDIGIIPGWGGTQRLARIVGPGMAKELIYTGRRVDAAEAKEIGLVNHVHPREDLEGRAMELARTIAAKSHPILVAAKDAINMTFETNMASGLKYEAQTWANLFETCDQKEGMCAFLEKRPPRFEDA